MGKKKEMVVKNQNKKYIDSKVKEYYENLEEEQDRFFRDYQKYLNENYKHAKASKHNKSKI